MNNRFTVTRTVHVNQSIVIKAPTASKALELARKSKFKEWSQGDRSKRTNYDVTEFVSA